MASSITAHDESFTLPSFYMAGVYTKAKREEALLKSMKSKCWKLVVLAATFAISTLALTPVLGSPAVETFPAAGSPKPIALVYVTGDLGLRFGLGGKVVPLLTHAGYAVSTINSAIAFRAIVPQRQVAALLDEAAKKAMASAHADRFAVIGHSFGADIIPPAISVLPEPLASRLAMVALVVPSRLVYDHVSLAEITELARPDRDALPAALSLRVLSRLCISGEKEEGSLCPSLDRHGYSWSRLPGGHHLDNNAGPLARLLRMTLDHLSASPR